LSHSEEEDTVITVVEQFLIGLAEKDMTTLHDVTLPVGIICSIYEAGGQVVVSSRTHEDFFQSIAVSGVVKAGCEKRPLGPPEFPGLHSVRIFERI
jgi:fructose-1,6-bisphosphatase